MAGQLDDQGGHTLRASGKARADQTIIAHSY